MVSNWRMCLFLGEMDAPMMGGASKQIQEIYGQLIETCGSGA